MVHSAAFITSANSVNPVVEFGEPLPGDSRHYQVFDAAKCDPRREIRMQIRGRPAQRGQRGGQFGWPHLAAAGGHAGQRRGSVDSRVHRDVTGPGVEHGRPRPDPAGDGDRGGVPAERHLGQRAEVANPVTTRGVVTVGHERGLRVTEVGRVGGEGGVPGDPDAGRDARHAATLARPSPAVPLPLLAAASAPGTAYGALRGSATVVGRSRDTHCSRGAGQRHPAQAWQSLAGAQARPPSTAAPKTSAQGWRVGVCHMKLDAKPLRCAPTVSVASDTTRTRQIEDKSAAELREIDFAALKTRVPAKSITGMRTGTTLLIM